MHIASRRGLCSSALAWISLPPLLEGKLLVMLVLLLEAIAAAIAVIAVAFSQHHVAMRKELQDSMINSDPSFHHHLSATLVGQLWH